MNLYDIMWKLWCIDGATCPCEAGIPCLYYDEENKCCMECGNEVDCLEAIIVGNDL